MDHMDRDSKSKNASLYKLASLLTSCICDMPLLPQTTEAFGGRPMRCQFGNRR